MDLTELGAKWTEWVTGEYVVTAIEVVVILVVGVGLSVFVRRRLAFRKLSAQHAFLLRRTVSYLLMGVAIAWSLRLLGLDLSVLLGAAGILTVAIGFASQTSASNLISGLFLMGEQPFVVGDFITVGDTTGEVLSIDLMSVKLRTFDNLQVRIPNETMLKSNVTTLTKFPIRRVDLKIGVAYKEDLERVRDLLMGIADRNPICLTEPAPLFIFLGYGDSSLNFQFSVWGTRENFLDLRNAMYLEIKAAFDEAGIEIPFPHRSLYAGSITEPIPVQVVGPDQPSSTVSR